MESDKDIKSPSSRLKRFSIGSLLFFLLACAHYQAMTRKEFYEIELRTPIAKIEATYGAPIYKYHDEEGYIVYEYVERVYMGSAIIEQNYYYFYVKDGVVYKKGQRPQNRPAWNDDYNADPVLDY